MSEHQVRRGQAVTWLVLGGAFATVGLVNLALAATCGELWPVGVAAATLLAALGSLRGALGERRRARPDGGRPAS
ncbi:hypothetical protein [Gandjariella thermophila]|uniref:Uncharacterized protein n=1 Tax=Gandjariella thermophila TaxID=1931992 RepID=A0A4D4J9H0_9PSEU|nr:hypothetical protein [Gandjariella thermophila]GDY33311.1 hypothetical protein GTS_49440 [Gandjariella thermophila]